MRRKKVSSIDLAYIFSERLMKWTPELGPGIAEVKV